MKVDRASMAHSLEVRVPFLDPDLVTHAFGLRTDYKMRGRQTKLILREALKNDLPDSILRRKKAGFAMPVASCLSQRANPKLCGLAPTTTVWGATYQQYLTRDSLIATTSGAKLVPARPYLCTATFCNSVIGSLITSVDADHFSTVFSTSLAPYMTPAVLAALK
jgi:hypothetical protein